MDGQMNVVEHWNIAVQELSEMDKILKNKPHSIFITQKLASVAQIKVRWILKNSIFVEKLEF